MDENTEMLHKICKALMEELEDYSKKIEKADGMSAGDLEAVDTLSHALKSIKTTIAMMEAEGGYSGHYMPRMGGYYAPGMSYAEDGRGGTMGGARNSNRGSNSYEGGRSYARGGRNNNPTGRNQYSREGGYSYAAEIDGVISDLESMIDDMPADKQRRVQQLMDELRR